MLRSNSSSANDGDEEDHMGSIIHAHEREDGRAVCLLGNDEEHSGEEDVDIELGQLQEIDDVSCL